MQLRASGYELRVFLRYAALYMAAKYWKYIYISCCPINLEQHTAAKLEAHSS